MNLSLKSWTFVAVAALLVVGGTAYWYARVSAPKVGGLDVSKENKAPNIVASTPEEQAKLVAADYFRASSSAAGTTLEWSASGATDSACTIGRYTTRAQGAQPDTTYKVDAVGALSVDDGHYYRLSCPGVRGGEKVTIQADLDLLPVSAN